MFIGSAFVAKYPKGGGNYWVPLQYVLGFRDLGVEAFWLEILESTGNADVDRHFIDTFLGYASELGVAPWTILAFVPRGARHHDVRTLHGISDAELASRQQDALLLNMVDSVNPALRDGFARTVLLDLDPGPFQVWAAEWGMGVGAHDIHLTIGQHLGASDSPVPLRGIPWEKTWPAIHLRSWPPQRDAGTSYTTITQWWGGGGASIGDTYFDCNKRNGFIEYVDLALRTPVRLELAANIHPSERQDIDLFTSRGWHLVQPEVLVRTPPAYRQYVQRSRGEFSCAKPAYVRMRSGWLSDRTVCYLASGRPCVVQDTGQSSHLPATLGLQCFSTVDEAVAALDRVEAAYSDAAAEARVLAEELFSTDVVLSRILRMAGM